MCCIQMDSGKLAVVYTQIDSEKKLLLRCSIWVRIDHNQPIEQIRTTYIQKEKKTFRESQSCKQFDGF